MVTEYERLYSIYKVNLVAFVNGELVFDVLKPKDNKEFKNYQSFYYNYVSNIRGIRDEIVSIKQDENSIKQIEELVVNNIFLEDLKTDL